MSIGQVIDGIWQLPWYKIFVVAVLDDVILLIKLWPVWAVMGVGAIGLIVLASRR